MRLFQFAVEGFVNISLDLIEETVVAHHIVDR